MPRGRKERWPRCPETGKVRFRDHRAATIALTQARKTASWASARDLPTKRAEARTYRCPHCKGWHLTSVAMFEKMQEDAKEQE